MTATDKMAADFGLTESEITERYAVTTHSPVAQRVTAGAQWLDENVPDWYGRVTLPEFDIKNRCNCVLGHVFASENEPAAYGFDRVVTRHWIPKRLEALVPDDREMVLTRPAARALGFDAAEDDAREFDELQTLWEEVISERQREARETDHGEPIPIGF